MNVVFSQHSQVTAEYPDLTLKSIHTRSLYISRHTLDLFNILQRQPREEFYKVYPLKQPNLKSYLSSIYFDTSLEGSIKENIDELIYEAIETVRSKKHKTPNEFSVCNYLNVNADKDKDFTECRIRYLLENGKLKNKPKNGVNSYFKIYSTDPAIFNDSDFSNKSNENNGNDSTDTQSNEDLIEALKSKLLDAIMPHTKILIKEELKFSKEEIDLVNSNTEIIKSLEKELDFIKQELVNKYKLIELYTSKIFGKGSNFDLDTELSTLNSKLVDETINS